MKRRIKKKLSGFIEERAQRMKTHEEASTGWVSLMGAIRFVEHLLRLPKTSLISDGLSIFIESLPETISVETKSHLLQGTVLMLSGVMGEEIRQRSGGWKVEPRKKAPTEPEGPIDGMTPEEREMNKDVKAPFREEVRP